MSGLNPEQKRAAETLRGPLLIGAGAGSGKTRTLAERFVNAVVGCDASGWEPLPSDRVAAITFTDAAAGELAERVRMLLRVRGRVEEARRIDGAWISTIHGLCSRLLRRHWFEAGLDPSLAVADTVQAGLMRERSFEAAAGEVVRTAEGGRLFSSWDYGQLYKTCKSIERAMMSGGVADTDIGLVSTQEPEEILSDAVRAYRHGIAELQVCGDAKSTLGNLAAASETLHSLQELSLASDGGEALASSIAEVLLADRIGGRLAAAAETVTRAILSERDRLAASAIEAATVREAAAFAQLLRTYLCEYERRKKAAGVVDFDDLQLRLLDLIDSDPEALRACADCFGLTMVDEFQDTDAVQLAIVTALAGENLCTVGDERQAIYGFRGADVGVYRAHNEKMAGKGAATVELFRNYRSHPDVLGFTNDVFGGDELFGDSFAPLAHGRDEPQPPFLPEGEPRIHMTFIRAGRNDGREARSTEAALLSEHFARMRDAHGISSSDMVVLVRRYTHAGVYADALRLQGFDVAIIGGRRFFGLPETDMMRALVRVMVNPRDDEALLALALSPASGLSDSSLLRVGSRVREKLVGSLWDALRDAGTFLESQQAEEAAKLVEAVTEAQKHVGRTRLSEALMRALERTGAGTVLLAGESGGQAAMANVLKFLRLADAFEDQGGTGLAAFGGYIDAKDRLGEHETPATLADERIPAVRIMSIHSVKGLEFPVVAVVGLGERGRSDMSMAMLVPVTEGHAIALAPPPGGGLSDKERKRLGSMAVYRTRTARSAAETDEEKRLFYVACTRAQEVLYLSGAGSGKTDAQNPLAWMRGAAPRLFDESPRQEADVSLGDGSRVVVRSRVVEAQPRADAAAPIPGRKGVGEGEGSRETGGLRPSAAPPSPSTAAGKVTPPRLSYSDMSAFETCPRRYWAERILRMGSPRPRGVGAQSFGAALHAVLRVHGETGVLPDETGMASIARMFELDRDCVADLTVAARTYASSELAARVAEGYARFEYPFAVNIGDGRALFTLVGAMDVYVRQGSSALIVDYKSGTGAIDDKFERYRLQAECYAVAALRGGAEMVELEFIRPQVSASDGQPELVNFTYAAEDIDGLESGLIDIRARMADGSRDPLAVWTYGVCDTCPAAGVVCPRRAAEEG